jgi:hypothetical protein
VEGIEICHEVLKDDQTVAHEVWHVRVVLRLAASSAAARAVSASQPASGFRTRDGSEERRS